MKTKEELQALKEEYEQLRAKIAELSEEELEQVTGSGDHWAPVASGGIHVWHM